MYNGQGQATTSANSVYMPPAAALPIAPMQDARQRLTNAIGYLLERMDQIEKRLDGVCGPHSAPPPATPVNAAGTPPVVQSELRQFLNLQTDGVALANMRLDSLLNRLEI